MAFLSQARTLPSKCCFSDYIQLNLNEQVRMRCISYHVSSHHFCYNMCYSLSKISFSFPTPQNSWKKGSMDSRVKNIYDKINNEKRFNLDLLRK